MTPTPSEPPQWEFPIRQVQDAFVLTITGQIMEQVDDALLRASFLVEVQQRLENLAQQMQTPKLVVCFEDHRFVTSGVLGMLVQVNTWVKRLGGQLHLAGLDPQASKVFALTKLDKLLKAYPTVEEAVAHFA